jgi:hypothetical protein
MAQASATTVSQAMTTTVQALLVAMPLEKTIGIWPLQLSF